MASDEGFELIFTKLTEAREAAADGTLRITIDRLQAQSDSIAELMTAAQELADPDPQYYSRG
jgi:hypothetical protein